MKTIILAVFSLLLISSSQAIAEQPLLHKMLQYNDGGQCIVVVLHFPQTLETGTAAVADCRDTDENGLYTHNRRFLNVVSNVRGKTHRPEKDYAEAVLMGALDIEGLNCLISDRQAGNKNDHAFSLQCSEATGDGY